MIIAIDGTCGSGKGTIAKILEEKLNLENIDTGATYRCLALYSILNNISIDDEEKLIEASKNIKIELKDHKVYLDGEDVSRRIREKDVTEIVSPISRIIEVRKNLVELQRSLAVGKNVVLEGRDITTVVFPNADFKFYLDATLEERTRRRLKQNEEMGIESSYDELYESMKNRDYSDMHKAVGALKRTDDQIYIDSTNMTIDEVVDKIVSVVRGEK